MKVPDDERSASPADRFRKILSAEDEERPPAETRKPPVVNLPRPAGARETPTASRSATPPAKEGTARGRFLPTFWTVASILSLLVNAILLVALFSVVRGLRAATAAGAGGGALGGLYNSLEQMDQAHIRTTIPIQTEVPLNMSLPVKSTTSITLAHDVAIQGARVRISTGQFNIDAPANVTLPGGTALDVTLDFEVPVQTNVPISMNVPVDIALHDTDLHTAIAGFEESVKPLLCASAPQTVSLSGQPVCR